MSLFTELKRRNVIRVAIAYLASAWLIIQIAETVLPVYGFTDAAMRKLFMLLFIGLFPALILSWIFEWTPSGFVRESGITQATRDTAVSRRLIDRLIVVVLTIAVAYFAIDKFVRHSDSGDMPSIAVLAFDDLSPGQDQQYLSEGIAETIMDQLTGVDGMVGGQW